MADPPLPPGAVLIDDAPARPKPKPVVAAAPKAAPARPKTPSPIRSTGDAAQFERFSGASRNAAALGLLKVEQAFTESAAFKKRTPEAQKKALATFRAHPNVRALARRAYGRPAPVLDVLEKGRIGIPLTLAEQMQVSAKERTAGRVSKTGKFATALSGGVVRGQFGVPEKLAAAGVAGYPLPLLPDIPGLPSAVTGNYSPATYEQTLQQARANTDEDMAQSLPGNLIGQVLAFGGLSSLATKVLQAGSAKVAAAGLPIASKAANYLQSLLTIKKGANPLKNAGKFVGQGAGYGAAQAGGTGEDPVEGAVYGAVAAGGLAGLVKGGQFGTRKVRDFLGLSSADQILRRYTNTTADELAAKVAQRRADTGAEPQIIDVLPLADVNRIMRSVVKGRDPVVETAEAATRARARNIGPEMAGRTREILTPRREAIRASIVDDLTDARGGTPVASDRAMAERAISAPRTFKSKRGVRKTEAREIMRAYDGMHVVGGISDLYPSVPNPSGGPPLITSPEAARMIDAVAGNLRFRAPGAGITVKEVTGMMKVLRAGERSADPNKVAAATNALRHLQGILDTHPVVGPASRKVVDRWAARSRMMEGIDEGKLARLESQIGPSQTTQAIDNAYETAEGAAGRVIGQGNKTLDSLEGSPEGAITATLGLAQDSRALAQNVGTYEASQIAKAARGQEETTRALATAQAAMRGGSAETNPEAVASAILGLAPGTMPGTKIGNFTKLMNLVRMPESRAKAIVDMIYSQDPAMVRRALRAVGNEPNGAAFLKYLSANMGIIGGGNPPEDRPDVPVSAVPEAVGEIPTVTEDPPLPPGAELIEEPDTGETPYGRAVIESIFPDAHINDDVRAPDSPLGRRWPDSKHVTTDAAVDVRPIPGMTFNEFIQQIENAGYQVIDKEDESKGPARSDGADVWGPHWHVVLG